SFTDSSESTVLSQTSAQRVDVFPRLKRRDLQFLVHFFVAYRDILFVCDAVQQNGRLHLGDGAFALTFAEPPKIELAHVFRGHALSGEGTESPLQPRVDLVLDE